VRGEFPTDTLIRPASMFGVNDALMTSLAVLTRLPVIPLFGRGQTRLQPVWVEDVARALAILATMEATPSPTYELGGGALYRYRDLVAAVQRHRHRRQPRLPVPFALWRLLAAGLGVLPNPPLTRDQVLLMADDNIVQPGMPGFDELGILPRGFTEALPECLPRP
jgi:NADH dehydrogenase